jgi:hypothetical protein
MRSGDLEQARPWVGLEQAPANGGMEAFQSIGARSSNVWCSLTADARRQQA